MHYPADDSPIESPVRETMQPSDHLSAELFGPDAIPRAETVPERHPMRIGSQSIHQWRSSH